MYFPGTLSCQVLFWNDGEHKDLFLLWMHCMLVSHLYRWCKGCLSIYPSWPGLCIAHKLPLLPCTHHTSDIAVFDRFIANRTCLHSDKSFWQLIAISVTLPSDLTPIISSNGYSITLALPMYLINHFLWNITSDKGLCEIGTPLQRALVSTLHMPIL